MDYTYSTDVSTASAGLFAGLALVYFLVMIAFYVYMGLCLLYMAKKTNTPNGWFGFIPILNVILMLQIAKKPIWWIILLLVPIVNIIIVIMVWMKMAEACGKESWWGILMIVPGVNLIVPAVLAFSKAKAQTPPVATPPGPTQ